MQKNRIVGKACHARALGACKVGVCRHNKDFECCAKEIQVGYKGSDVLCLTFEQK